MKDIDSYSKTPISPDAIAALMHIMYGLNVFMPLSNNATIIQKPLIKPRVMSSAIMQEFGWEEKLVVSVIKCSSGGIKVYNSLWKGASHREDLGERSCFVFYGII